MHGAGISGGVEFFKTHLVSHCNIKKSYSVTTMAQAMDLDAKKRIYKKAAEQLHGKAMARAVKELLVDRFTPAPVQEDEIEFD
jgi:hypothetical protein